jgi:hypothetical protein
MASDEAVIKAASMNKEDYSPEIQEIIESEVEKRGLLNKKLPTVKETARETCRSAVSVLVKTVGIIALLVVCFMAGELGETAGDELWPYLDHLHPIQVYILLIMASLIIAYYALRRR